MKPLHSLLILPFLIINTLGLSPVAVPDTYSSTYENRTFNHNVIQAFARLNGTWSPKIRSYTTLEDLASILSGQWAFLGNATKSSAYTDRRSHHVHNWDLGAWEDEINLARAAHIDGFALNFGSGVPYDVAILKAVIAANKVGFKFVFSFDYAGKPLVSTFEGSANAVDWVEIKAAVDCFFMPDWSSLGAKDALALKTADGLFNWAAWPWGNTDMDTYVDASYLDYLERDDGKPYMMPVSPWFYTNLPGYNKNWLWRGDNLWRDLWEEVMVVQPDLVQIISWNDFGESHYIGPLPKGDYKAFEVGKAPYDYITGMPHDAWRKLLPYWIDTYKKGKASISEELVVGWYRPNPAAACNSGGTSGNTAQQLQIEFDPAEVAQDIIVFSAVLASDASISVMVGGVALPAKWENKPSGGVGVYHGSVAYGGNRGAVKITISRSGNTIASFTGTDITTSCPDGYTNWNAWGTAKGNFKGLCEFTCSYGYCPTGACVCLELGPPKKLPEPTGVKGYPIAGEGSSYIGLCDFACNYGHCPPSACGTTEVALTEPTVSPFLPSACTSGTGNDNFIGLCQYACDFGFCPIKHCTCTSTGTLVPPPAQDLDYDGEWTLEGDDSGLCSFACSRSYCPETACKSYRPNEVVMCNDDSEDPQCLTDALADSEACDLSLTFNTMTDLENSLSTIPSGCTGIHTMQVLLKLLKSTKANYTAVDNDYDYWFNYYVKYMHRVVPEQIWSFVSYGNKGPGNKYFDCTLRDGEHHDPQTCPVGSLVMSYHVDYDFNDEEGFWNDAAERGIQKDWISFEDWDITKPCPPKIPLHPDTCRDGMVVLEDYPHPADNMTFVNPKDILSKSNGRFDQLELDIATTWTEMMFGFWDGDFDDAAEAVSLPVFMLAQAVESMEQVKQLGMEEKKYEETELIMKILTAILVVVPFAGEIVGEIAGLAWVVEAAIVVDIVGNAAMSVYDAVKNKGSPAMAVLDLLLGSARVRTGKNYSHAASKRREMGAEDVSKFGDVFKRHDDALRRWGTSPTEVMKKINISAMPGAKNPQCPLLVDFVLESGSDQVDNSTQTATNVLSPAGSLHSYAESNPIPERLSPGSSYTAPLPQYGLSNHQVNTSSSAVSPTFPVVGTPERSNQRPWPLRDPEEARLLQHFVDKVAPFFDCTDRQQHFAIHIPYRARRCETLFNAILAMSARHLNRTTAFDPFVSDRYYQACLEKLIPALNDHGVTMDDDLLAATVILRLLEEFDVPLAGSDIRGHSFGTKAFIRSPSMITTTSSLRQAVYWSGLRQEIYNSLSLHQTPDIELRSLDLNSHFNSLGPGAGDCAWANQAITHCAHVLVFCFGEGPRSAAVHADLKVHNQQWSETRPDTFDPYFVGEDGEVGTKFPDIRYGCPWHAIGNQYIDLAQILLSVHDPTLPTVGPLRRRLIQEADEVQDHIRSGVWKVCGASLSNASVPPAMVVGCMAIHLCGDRFTDPHEQDHLIQVLIQTDKLHGWPTHALQRQLRETWGMC
ncbi:Glycoside hydrolase, family 71 [Penicillium expansum]|nr:Glycoside hydrolase, family 71 [Penicillium expansum]